MLSKFYPLQTKSSKISYMFCMYVLYLLGFVTLPTCMEYSISTIKCVLLLCNCYAISGFSLNVIQSADGWAKKPRHVRV